VGCKEKEAGLLCESEDGSGREEKRSKTTCVRSLDIEMRQAASENAADEDCLRSAKQRKMRMRCACMSVAPSIR
jgi:hypothetical protein